MSLNIDSAGEANRKMNEFVNTFTLEHFGEHPKDEVQARSDALNAYYESEGYSFGTDEDSFILPKLTEEEHEAETAYRRSMGLSEIVHPSEDEGK